MEDCVLTLIVVSPGPLRDGLRALLTAIPQVENLREVDDASSALRAIEEHPPALVLIDVDPPGDEAWELLRQIKAGWLLVRSILLVDDAQQQRLAEAAGADCALIKGFPASKLSATIKSLLPRHL